MKKVLIGTTALVAVALASASASAELQVKISGFVAFQGSLSLTDTRSDNFDRDYANYKAKGVAFVREPKEEEPYGTVAVFRDLYGILWDLIQPGAPQTHGAA